MPQLTSSSLSNLYTIPESDWTAINQRVGAAMSAINIASLITLYLPSFPALITACQLWQKETFDELISQSQQLAAYSAQAIQNFSSLNERIKELDPNATTVPNDIQQLTVAILNELANATTPLSNTFTKLSTEVVNFLNVNKDVDAEIAKNKDKLGSFWAPLGQTITTLENAAGLVTGEWNAISSDLTQTVNSPINVTLPFLTSLDIQAAIICWQSIQMEATAFPVLAANQKHYWKGI